MVISNKRAFEILEGYAREKHNRFLAEMTRNGEAYRLCFRPLAPDRRSSNRYAYKYLALDLGVAEQIAFAGRVTEREIQLLDEALVSLAATD